MHILDDGFSPENINEFMHLFLQRDSPYSYIHVFVFVTTCMLRFFAIGCFSDTPVREGAVPNWPYRGLMKGLCPIDSPTCLENNQLFHIIIFVSSVVFKICFISYTIKSWLMILLLFPMWYYNTCLFQTGWNFAICFYESSRKLCPFSSYTGFTTYMKFCLWIQKLWGISFLS